MRLLTWNLDGLDDHALDERTEAAVFVSVLGARLDELHSGVTAAAPPDVIVFQEVVERTFHAHVRRHLSAAGYTVLPDTPPARQTFETIAYRPTFRLRAYQFEPLHDSVYGRILHIADFETADPAALVAPGMRVMTGHFDSGTESARVRAAQLRQVASHLGAHGVFAGDANLRKAEWLDLRDDLPMRDAWEVLGEPSATRVTWRRDDYKARFDRIFVGPGLRPSGLAPVGAGMLPGLDVPISDHVGLRVELHAGAGPETPRDFVPA